MATDWTSPKTSDTHTNELAATRGRDESNARMDYTGDTNIPDGTIRWNKANNRFEIWSAASSTWSVLSSKYLINVDTVDGYHAGNASGNVPVSNGTVNTNLNADKLDGQHGTFFQARANHTGTQAPSTISPQGAGSGLNADMLDGYHSSYFETPDGAQAKAYGVFTSPTYGTVDWNTLDNPGANILNMGNAANGPGPSSYFHCMVINYSGHITQLAIPYGNSMAPGIYMRGRYNNVWTAWEKVWTTSNDGSGSGLDADLLDGKHATSFVLTSDYENADVLAKVKAVDGAGSGLDADLIDGLHASEIGGGKIFTSSGTFTVPAGVTEVYVSMCGGGGGGGGGGSNSKGGPGGGAGAYFKKPVTVTPGATYTITVGAGGAGGAGSTTVNGQPGQAGGTSSFGSLLSATGGGGGGGATQSSDGTKGTPGTAPGGFPGRDSDSYFGWGYGIGYGSGGSGGSTGSKGGDGAPGFVLIEW